MTNGRKTQVSLWEYIPIQIWVNKTTNSSSSNNSHNNTRKNLIMYFNSIERVYFVVVVVYVYLACEVNLVCYGTHISVNLERTTARYCKAHQAIRCKEFHKQICISTNRFACPNFVVFHLFCSQLTGHCWHTKGQSIYSKNVCAFTLWYVDKSERSIWVQQNVQHDFVGFVSVFWLLASCLICFIGADDAPAIDINQLYHSNKPALTQDAATEQTVDSFDPFIGTRHDEFDWLLTKVRIAKFFGFVIYIVSKWRWRENLLKFQKVLSSASENTVLSPFLVKLLVSNFIIRIWSKLYIIFKIIHNTEW